MGKKVLLGKRTDVCNQYNIKQTDVLHISTRIGTYTIAKQLEALGKVNKKGVVKWTDSGIRGIIKNEKYKGDLLLQKTITTDPISKRRIENFGEEEQYYVHDHHEPIVSKEVWEQAKEIRLSLNRQSDKKADGKREMYTKKYALSSMCECGFCGTKLTRRTLHSSSKYETPVWYCRNAANKGKHNCPNSKSVHESILENAFLEAYKLLAGSFDDVINSVVDVIENISTSNEDIGRLKKEQKASLATDTRGNSLPSVEKSPINQRFLQFWKKNGCVFLFPQSEDISRGLPQGIGFGE